MEASCYPCSVRLLWRSDASLLFLGLEKGARKAVWTEGKINSKTRAFRAVEVDGNTVVRQLYMWQKNVNKFSNSPKELGTRAER